MDAVMATNLIFLAAGVCAGLLLAFGLFGPRFLRAERARAALRAELDAALAGRGAMEGAFAQAAREALQKNSEQFMQLAQEKLRQAQAEGAHDLEKKHKDFATLVTPVAENLKTLNSAVEQIKGTDKMLRDDLQSLSRETARLAGALNNPSAQGRWGEYVLERLLDNSGLMKGVHYHVQASLETAEGRLRPDVVIKLHDGFNIVIDAKAPVNHFADDLHEESDPAEHTRLQQELARHVRDHAKKLGAKNYWEQLDSPDFVVLFLPSELLFSAALRADPDLADFAAQQRVVIASPTLIIALLRVVGLSWRQVELARNAQQIAEAGSDLFQRLSTFGAHLEKAGKGLGAALEGYNKAVGSFERMIVPASKRLRDLHVQTAGKELPAADYIEATPRPFAPALPAGNDDEENRKAHG